MSSASLPTRPDRRLDLDWVRILAFGVLILFHVGMYYVTWGWHVKSPFASHTLEPLMMLSSPWRLSLLFFVSGCATAFLHAMSATGFVRSRTQRLLIPLALGLWVIVPPQSWAEVTEAVGYHGGYLHFMRLYAEGYSGFCRDGCLRIPTWNHLWFVAYLWCYTMLAALAWWAIPQERIARWSVACGRALHGPWLFVLPMAWLAAIRVALVTRFPDTHALVDDWFEHATYFSVFVLGLLLARETGVWEEIRRQRWRALVLALASYALVAAYFSQRADVAPPDWLRQGQRVIYALDQWAAIVAALGFARQWNPGESRARRYLTEAIFPFYIVHQTAIVLLAHFMKPLGLRPLVEGPLLIAATVAVCLATFEIVRRIGWLRPLFGLEPFDADAGRPAVTSERLVAAGRAASVVVAERRVDDRADALGDQRAACGAAGQTIQRDAGVERELGAELRVPVDVEIDAAHAAMRPVGGQVVDLCLLRVDAVGRPHEAGVGQADAGADGERVVRRETHREVGVELELQAAVVGAAAVQQARIERDVAREHEAVEAAGLDGEAALVAGVVGSLRADAVVQQRAVVHRRVVGDVPAQRADLREDAVAPQAGRGRQHDDATLRAAFVARHVEHQRAQVQVLGTFGHQHRGALREARDAGARQQRQGGRRRAAILHRECGSGFIDQM